MSAEAPPSVVPRDFYEWSHEDQITWCLQQFRVMDPWTLYGHLKRHFLVFGRKGPDGSRAIAAALIEEAADSTHSAMVETSVGTALIIQRLLEAADIARNRRNPTAMVRAMEVLNTVRSNEAVRVAAMQLLAALSKELPEETYQEVHAALLRLVGASERANRSGKRAPKTDAAHEDLATRYRLKAQYRG